ncbi:MAG: hypothetical protein JG776_2190 [Caloramator sp.]|jgi:tellurium resistance protein TerD|uniref:hypothetical protein n=1 Tax=Caloramator sp. TaxID=1871330 RepID=UPI001DA7EB7B|nr:hypothetical protein [Caloramator sp.]MBZ4664472.1 hypothetical protein [Caloramator sp.]
MKYFSEDSNYINAECEKCNKVLKIKREYCNSTNEGFKLNPPIRCFCGNVSDFIFGDSKNIATSSNNIILKCPRCGSTQIAAGNKGFGLGKAAAGGLLLGPVGLLGGLIGSRKVIITCLMCGKKWEAGKRY